MKRKNTNISFKVVTVFVSIIFILSGLSFGLFNNTNLIYASNLDSQLLKSLDMPSGLLSTNNRPYPQLKAIEFSLNKPLHIRFHITNNQLFKLPTKDISKLIKYFLGFLTIPQNDLWVNLSPYESDKIIPSNLEKLDIGQDMLLEDYLLKKIASNLTNPKTSYGKKFWADINRMAYSLAKTNNLEIQTFNKIWIVPDQTKISEYISPDNTKKIVVYIKEAKLKVLLEEDLLALENNIPNKKTASLKKAQTINKLNKKAKEIFKQQLLPVINQYINQSEAFAPLRQLYQAFILSIYFKDRLRQHPIYRNYIDQNKSTLLVNRYSDAKKYIYQAYLENFAQGNYRSTKENLIRDPSGKAFYRFMSGGAKLQLPNQGIEITPTTNLLPPSPGEEIIDTQLKVKAIESSLEYNFYQQEMPLLNGAESQIYGQKITPKNIDQIKEKTLQDGYFLGHIRGTSIYMDTRIIYRFDDFNISEMGLQELLRNFIREQVQDKPIISNDLVVVVVNSSQKLFEDFGNGVIGVSNQLLSPNISRNLRLKLLLLGLRDKIAYEKEIGLSGENLKKFKAEQLTKNLEIVKKTNINFEELRSTGLFSWEVKAESVKPVEEVIPPIADRASIKSVISQEKNQDDGSDIPQESLGKISIEEWSVERRKLGQFGRAKKNIFASYDRNYGSGNWCIAWQVGDKYLSFVEICAYYEAAYYQYFKDHPEDLQYLINNASDVWDNAYKNVDSDCDYSKQGGSTHIQDIAIRRIIKITLKERFKGKELIRISSRSKDFIGQKLSPGKVPFNKPELIASPSLKKENPDKWWGLYSVEDFYQTNKVLLVRKSGYLKPKIQLKDYSPEIVKEPKNDETLARPELVVMPITQVSLVKEEQEFKPDIQQDIAIKTQEKIYPLENSSSELINAWAKGEAITLAENKDIYFITKINEDSNITIADFSFDIKTTTYKEAIAILKEDINHGNILEIFEYNSETFKKGKLLNLYFWYHNRHGQLQLLPLEYYISGKSRNFVQRTIGWLDFVKWLKQEPVIVRDNKESFMVGKLKTNGAIWVRDDTTLINGGLLSITKSAEGYVIGFLDNLPEFGLTALWYSYDINTKQIGQDLLNALVIRDGRMHSIKKRLKDMVSLSPLEEEIKTPIVNSPIIETKEAIIETQVKIDKKEEVLEPAIKKVEKEEGLQETEDMTTIFSSIEEKSIVNWLKNGQILLNKDEEIRLVLKVKEVNKLINRHNTNINKFYFGRSSTEDVMAILHNDINHGTVLEFFEYDKVQDKKGELINIYYFEDIANQKNVKPELRSVNYFPGEHHGLGWLDIVKFMQKLVVIPRDNEKSFYVTKTLEKGRKIRIKDNTSLIRNGIISISQKLALPQEVIIILKNTPNLGNVLDIYSYDSSTGKRSANPIQSHYFKDGELLNIVHLDITTAEPAEQDETTINIEEVKEENAKTKVEEVIKDEPVVKIEEVQQGQAADAQVEQVQKDAEHNNIELPISMPIPALEIKNPLPEKQQEVTTSKIDFADLTKLLEQTKQEDSPKDLITKWISGQDIELKDNQEVRLVVDSKDIVKIINKSIANCRNLYFGYYDTAYVVFLLHKDINHGTVLELFEYDKVNDKLGKFINLYYFNGVNLKNQKRLNSLNRSYRDNHTIGRLDIIKFATGESVITRDNEKSFYITSITKYGKITLDQTESLLASKGLLPILGKERDDRGKFVISILKDIPKLGLVLTLFIYNEITHQRSARPIQAHYLQDGKFINILPENREIFSLIEKSFPTETSQIPICENQYVARKNVNKFFLSKPQDKEAYRSISFWLINFPDPYVREKRINLENNQEISLARVMNARKQIRFDSRIFTFPQAKTEAILFVLKKDNLGEYSLECWEYAPSNNLKGELIDIYFWQNNRLTNLNSISRLKKSTDNKGGIIFQESLLPIKSTRQIAQNHDLANDTLLGLDFDITSRTRVNFKAKEMLALFWNIFFQK